MATVDDLISTLQRSGVTQPSDLLRLLGISAPTLSRLVRKAGNRVVRLGSTRGVRYAIPFEVSHVGTTLPLWSIDTNGFPTAFATVHFLQGSMYWLEPADALRPRTRGHLYEGMPPFLADMAPQGYLGRFFPERFPELDLPPRTIDWSDNHQLQAIALRGEDSVGHLIAGRDSMNRFLASEPQLTTRAEYPNRTRNLAHLAVGSSAAGEFPKFTAFNGKHHLLVKFTGGDGSPADLRWKDLLICEELAARTLADVGFATPRTEAFTVANQLFLEIERFDRIGLRGRRGVLSLASLDDDLYGSRDSWHHAAARLAADRLLSQEDADKIHFLEAFARLIANTDRHFGNISFLWDPFAAANELRLSPVYDMLPMQFAPAPGGMVIEREYDLPTPTADLLDYWDAARSSASQFWQHAADDPRLSDGIRQLADSAAAKTKIQP